MNIPEILSIVTTIAMSVARAVSDAIAAGDVSAVEELTKHLPEGEKILARSAALRVSQLRAAEAALGSGSAVRE